MQLVETSTTISFDPDPVYGALNQGALTWTKGRLSKFGKWARFYMAQVTADNQITVSLITDKKGTPTSQIDLALTTHSDFEKAGNFKYCTRCNTNRACNIFQKDNLWTLIQFSFETSSKVRENIIEFSGTTGDYVDKFSRWKRHLYFIVKNDTYSTETLYYVDLADYNNSEFIPIPTAAIVKQSVGYGTTDILAGEDTFYLADGTDIKLYDHGILSVVSDTWSGVYTADSYDDYPVQMMESDDLDILVRKKGTQLYRILDGDVTLLSDTLDEDLSRFRVNALGSVYVEGADFTQTAGTLDEHDDKWYLINDSLTLDTYLAGVVQEILVDSGVSVDDIDLTEIADTQCRGFKIEGHTQMEALQELMVLYDFSLPIIGGKVYAKKITNDTVSETIAETKIGMGLNSAPQTAMTIVDEIADTDYPKQVTVRFADADDNYVDSAVILRSQDSDSSTEENLDFSNHSLGDSVARTAAHGIFQRWYSEKGFINFTCSIYYLEEIVPGALLSLTYGSETYDLKVTAVTIQDILLDVTAVRNYV